MYLVTVNQELCVERSPARRGVGGGYCIVAHAGRATAPPPSSSDVCCVWGLYSTRLASPRLLLAVDDVEV